MWIKSHIDSKGSCTIFIKLSLQFMLQLKYYCLIITFFSRYWGWLLRVLLHSTGSTAGCSRGGFCPLHQPVPWLRAPDADGAPIALPLFPGDHGWIQRWVTLPSGCITVFFFPCIFTLLSSPQCFTVLSTRHKVYFWFLTCSPHLVLFRNVPGQKRAAENSHIYGSLPGVGSNVCKAVYWYVTHQLYVSGSSI